MARLRRAGRSGLREAPRVNHGDNQFALGPNHINGIESFWSYTKARLAKFHGLRRETFPLHLKETEFRFNHRHCNLYKVLLSTLRKEPL
jgi:transposase-like protein